MAEYQIVWVPCEISEGAFSREYSVRIRQPDGQEISFFADKSIVRDADGQAYVRATLYGNGDGAKKNVLLPSESFETGTRWISLTDKEFALA